MRKMAYTKGLILLSLVCLALADVSQVPGPVETSSRIPSSPSTASPTNKPMTSTTTEKPTPLPTSATTPKSTTTPSTTSLTPSTTTPSPKTTTTKPTTTPITTAKPTTTPTTAKPTTPIPVNPKGKWVVYNNTGKACLVLEAELEVDLHYKVNNATKILPINITSAAKSQGACGEKVENITLNVDNSAKINFNFWKSNDSKKYDLESVIVWLNVTVPGFNGTQYYMLAHKKNEFSTPVSNSYKCEKEQTLALTSVPDGKDYGGELKISQFQVQAFRHSNNTKFDEALDCLSSETPDVVPIAVGCALAALVIIVLIAYLIGRRRSQARGYLSM